MPGPCTHASAKQRNFGLPRSQTTHRSGSWRHRSRVGLRPLCCTCHVGSKRIFTPIALPSQRFPAPPVWLSLRGTGLFQDYLPSASAACTKEAALLILAPPRDDTMPGACAPFPPPIPHCRPVQLACIVSCHAASTCIGIVSSSSCLLLRPVARPPDVWKNASPSPDTQTGATWARAEGARGAGLMLLTASASSYQSASSHVGSVVR